jgi:hypothetical protein
VPPLLFFCGARVFAAGRAPLPPVLSNLLIPFLVDFKLRREDKPKTVLQHGKAPSKT